MTASVVDLTSRRLPPDRLTEDRYSILVLERLAGNTSVSDFARQAGVSARSVWRWRHHGLDEWRADRLAIAFGFHPCEVWPEWDRTAED